MQILIANMILVARLMMQDPTPIFDNGYGTYTVSRQITTTPIYGPSRWLGIDMKLIPTDDFLIFSDSSRAIVKFKRDGTIELAPGVEPSEAAKLFIQEVKRLWPDVCTVR